MAGPWNRHRRDKSHDSVIKRLRDLGCSVLDLSQVGNGAPDLLVGVLCRNYLVEVKSPGKWLTEEQAIWHRDWLGTPPVVMQTAEDAEKWVNATRNRLFAEFGIK